MMTFARPRRAYTAPEVLAAEKAAAANFKRKSKAAEKANHDAAVNPLQKAAACAGGRRIELKFFPLVRFHLWRTTPTAWHYVGSFVTKEEARTWISRDFDFIGSGSFMTTNGGEYLDK